MGLKLHKCKEVIVKSEKITKWINSETKVYEYKNESNIVKMLYSTDRPNLTQGCITVLTVSILTPKRTLKADLGFALGPLRVCFSKICVRFGSARGSL